ncbi:hypothetical protein ACFQX6_12635 [Streptosporangium lutulentum]
MFCADSPAVLAETGSPPAKERCILLLFTMNRAAVPVAEQAATAWLGWQVAFGDDELATVSTVFTRRSAPVPSTFEKVETTSTTTVDPAELREAMVARFTDSGHLRSPEVIEAFRKVERHRFIPDADVEAAYADDAVSVKHDETGEMISCISAPSIVALQLQQLDAQPGHKVLEAGAATGYNAALVRHEAPPFPCGDERSPPSSCRSRPTKPRAV